MFKLITSQISFSIISDRLESSKKNSQYFVNLAAKHARLLRAHPLITYVLKVLYMRIVFTLCTVKYKCSQLPDLLLSRGTVYAGKIVISHKKVVNCFYLHLINANAIPPPPLVHIFWINQMLIVLVNMRRILLISRV
jgi:hypothetical protein